MSLGPVMLDLKGEALQEDEHDLLRHPATGGVILFARNYRSPRQLYRLIQAIHELREDPLLVAVDQEGGRVQRFREGFTRLPPAATVLRHFGNAGAAARAAARELGWLMAVELRSCGVDFSFAPVLDIDYGVSSVIGDRAFGGDPQAVSALAGSWMRGAREVGMISVGKHFPGHGAVAADSHLELPVDGRSLEQVCVRDLPPFAELIGEGLEAVMPAHVIYSECDPEPAGFSRFWLKQVLRGDLRFDGVIFSDDLSMEAAGQAGGYPARARAALVAGCDMVLVCNNQDAAREVLASLQNAEDAARARRLAALRARPMALPAFERLHQMPRWQQARELAVELLGDDA